MFKKRFGLILLLFCLAFFSQSALAVTMPKSVMKAVAHKIKLSAVPGLKVTQNNGSVVLRWGKPAKGIKYAGYTIFRSEQSGALGKIIAYQAKSAQSFTDKKVTVNHVYFYSIRYYAANTISVNGRQIKIKIVKLKPSSSPAAAAATTSASAAPTTATGSPVIVPAVSVPAEPNIFSSVSPTVAPVVDASASANDITRLTTLKQLQIALAQYFAARNSYPAGSGIVIGGSQDNCLNSDGWGPSDNCPYPYFENIPPDPGTGSYIYNSTGSSFTVEADLDGTVNGFSGTIILTPSGLAKK